MPGMVTQVPVQVGAQVQAGEVLVQMEAMKMVHTLSAPAPGRVAELRCRAGDSVRGGDVLVAEDGSLVRVLAAPQPVLRITPCPAHGTPFDLLRAAYHLGNRHVALQVGEGWLRLLDDYVLKAMLDQLGATVASIEAPFQPEHGAYGGGHHHSHHGEAEFNYAPKLHQFGVRT
jgi:urease accessory protein UreE